MIVPSTFLEVAMILLWLIHPDLDLVLQPPWAKSWLVHQATVKELQEEAVGEEKTPQGLLMFCVANGKWGFPKLGVP